MTNASEKQPELPSEARRCFLKAGLGLLGGAALFSAGAFTRIFEFFFGPRLSEGERANLLSLRLQRAEGSVQLSELELQRDLNPYTLISPLSDLNSSTGKYFIDYEMRPALAFVDDKGLPNLLSAKCTHLGCTVGNQVDEQGRILCPCHISYFDIKTGQPNPGAPAKLPLAHLPWVLMDKQKKVIARCDERGNVSGNLQAEAIKDADLYVAKSAQDSQS